MNNVSIRPEVQTIFMVGGSLILMICATVAVLFGRVPSYQLAILVAGLSIAASYYFAFVSPRRDQCPRWIPTAFALTGAAIAGTAGKSIIPGYQGILIVKLSYIGFGILILFSWFQMERLIEHLSEPRKSLSELEDTSDPNSGS